MNRIVDKLKAPLIIFGVLELGIGVLSILNLALFPHLESGGKFLGLFNAMVATLVIVFPMTFLFGMIFPIAGLCYVKSVSRTGSSVGWLYSSNTIGSIVGSLLAGFLLIPALGSTKTVLLLAYLNIFLGVILLYLQPGRYVMQKVAYGAFIVIFIIMTLGVRRVDPFLLMIEKKIIQRSSENPWGSKEYKIFFHKEGVEGTVTAFSLKNGKRLWVNGVGMTMLCPETKLMAHLPLLFTTEPRECLVICFGMGTTVKSASLYPNLNVTSVELVPEVYQTFKYYHSEAEEILKKKNVHTVVADGRNYLLLSLKKYDVITVDPPPPIYSAGTVNLYTKEFFNLCREHLAPQGVLVSLVPLRNNTGD